MKNEKLLRALEQVEENYILEATPEKISDEPYRNNLTGVTQKKKGSVKKDNITRFYKKPGVVAAAVVMCVCVLGTTGLAMTGHLQGFFKDVYRVDGVVVGTSYEQATDEIKMYVTETGDNLVVDITLLYPDKMPYKELERLGIGDYKIVDANDNVIQEGMLTETAEIVGGKVSLAIPMENKESGSYSLIISELTGSKEAEQPLTISGMWVCEFVR